jgi:hypothetical protein
MFILEYAINGKRFRRVYHSRADAAARMQQLQASGVEVGWSTPAPHKKKKALHKDGAKRRRYGF